MEEIVKALLEQLAQANATIVELSKVIADSKQAVSTPVWVEPPQWSPLPLHVPESEEDARAKYEAGEITKDQLQEVLTDLEFYNAEISIPTGS